jgi:hypothetical protein
LRGVRGLASTSGRITRLIGGGLSLFDLIVDKAVGEPCSRVDALFGAVLLIGGSIAVPAAVKESDFPPRTAGMSVSFEPRLPLFSSPSVNRGDPVRQSVGAQVSYIIKVPRGKDRLVVPPEVVAYPKSDVG